MISRRSAVKIAQKFAFFHLLNPPWNFSDVGSLVSIKLNNFERGFVLMKMNKNRWDYKNVKSIIRIFMFVVLFVLRFFLTVQTS